VTIKKFPELFAIVIPILARYPEISVDVFGSGGYSYVSELKRLVGPLGDRVRFWGHQRDVHSVFSRLDYLLTGLPEREGLGLNILEAQASGVGVLAPHAPPFSEAVLDGLTGYLYDDPREDQGKSFELALRRAMERPLDFGQIAAREHLARFSFDAFLARLEKLLKYAFDFLAKERRESLA
jgi:glycosyltransferase involved in cell wall biosynthesis